MPIKNSIQSIMEKESYMKTTNGLQPCNPKVYMKWGHEVDIYDPDSIAEYLCEYGIDPIAHSLSLQCRYAGQTPHLYSVAAHSLLAMDIAAEYVSKKDMRHYWEMQYVVLMHDAAEAFVGDIIRPIKNKVKELVSSVRFFDQITEACNLKTVHSNRIRRLCRELTLVESNVEKTIFDLFRVPAHDYTYYDNKAAEIEIKYFFEGKELINEDNEPAFIDSFCYLKEQDPSVIKSNFMEAFYYLNEKLHEVEVIAN